jgi:hypothetical protein
MMEWFQQDGFHYFLFYLLVVVMVGFPLGILSAMLKWDDKWMIVWVDPTVEIVFSYNCYYLGLYFLSGVFAYKCLANTVNSLKEIVKEEVKSK